MTTTSEHADTPNPDKDRNVPAPPRPLLPEALEAFRIPRNDIAESEPIPTAPSVRKPRNVEWFRTYPDDTVWFRCILYTEELGMTRVAYLVAPSMAAVMGATASRTLLIPCKNLQGELFFWPVKEGDNLWSQSARDMASDARAEWRRMESDKETHCYRGFRAKKEPPAPDWQSVQELEQSMLRAFERRMIKDDSHPIVAKLQLG